MGTALKLVSRNLSPLPRSHQSCHEPFFTAARPATSVTDVVPVGETMS